jgi:myo-inositol-1(or 4)-monophosphatase
VSDFSYDAALKAAIAAADAAAGSLMANFGRRESLNTWMKSPGALVTDADLAADRAIAESLAGTGLDAAVLSEESSSGDAAGELTWLVDPLCGTVPYRSGMPHWGVNIALRKGPELAASVVALPALGKTLSATAGRGVTLNGEPYAGADPGLPLHEATVGLEVDGGAEWLRLLGAGVTSDSQLRWPGAVSHTNTFASAAYPIAQVCMGGMSGVVFYKIDSMHFAAGALIAQELGAIVSDENGNPLDWRSTDSYPVALVAWPSIHDALVRAMRRQR